MKTLKSIVRGKNQLAVVAQSDDMHCINMIGAVGKSWFDDSGITESEFRDALNTIPKGKKIQLNVNSEGGSVQEGLGIYNAIKERKQDITAKINGYALSIASVFPLAAGKVSVPNSAIWMIHNAWAWGRGNADEMRKQADMLDKHDQTIASIYQEHTGLPLDKINEMMDAETWMTGPEAVEMGFGEIDDSADDTQASFHELPKSYLERCKNPVNFGIAVAIAGNRISAANAAGKQTAAAEIGGTNQTPQKTMTEKTPAAAVTPDATKDNQADALAQVKAQLATERKARITAEVTRRAENKITNANLDWWINQAVSDEAGTLAQIDALPTIRTGTEPLGAGPITTSTSILAGWGEKPTNTIENIFKEQSNAAKRFDLVKANWNKIQTEAARKDGSKPGVMMANSYSATLTTNFLILGATTKLSPKFAAIRAFSRDVSTDPYKPLASGVMKFTSTLQDGSTVQTNATNFENTNSTVDAVTISVSQYSNGGSLTNSDLNSGIRMEDLSRAILMGLGSKIMQTATAPITAANYTTTPLVAALDPNAFGFSESRQLYAKLKYAMTRNLILDTEYTAGLLNQPGYFQNAIEQQLGPGHWQNVFGWDNVFENTEWSGAGANVHGFACDPQAIGVIAGLPLVNEAGIPGGILSVSTGVIPGCDLPIAVYMWFSTASRTYWVSFDTMFGAAKLDGTAGVLITNQ